MTGDKAFWVATTTQAIASVFEREIASTLRTGTCRSRCGRTTSRSREQAKEGVA